MDCCVGDTRVNFGTWYSPNGKTPEECTYCEYCINNKCINISEVYKLEDQAVQCSCDCPNKKIHPKLYCYFCPKCEIERFNKMRPTSQGTCKRCKYPTPFITQAYCASCSIELNSCYDCGLPIKDGNIYIQEIETIITKQIQEIKNYMINDKINKNIQQHLKTMDMLNKQLQKTKELFTDKTSDQMRAIIMDCQRKRFSQIPSQIPPQKTPQQIQQQIQQIQIPQKIHIQPGIVTKKNQFQAENHVKN